MYHLLDSLNEIRRPRLLIQAARIGAATYRRDLHLRRLFGAGPTPRSTEALSRLMEMESEMNRSRKGSDAAYIAADHVDLLIAMMGEARLARAAYAPRPDAATKEAVASRPGTCWSEQFISGSRPGPA